MWLYKLIDVPWYDTCKWNITIHNKLQYNNLEISFNRVHTSNKLNQKVDFYYFLIISFFSNGQEIPFCSNATTRKNPLICNFPFCMAVNFEHIMWFKKYLRIRMSKQKVNFFFFFSFQVTISYRLGWTWVNQWYFKNNHSNTRFVKHIKAYSK